MGVARTAQKGAQIVKRTQNMEAADARGATLEAAGTGYGDTSTPRDAFDYRGGRG